MKKKKDKKELTPEQQWKILADGLMRELMIVCPLDIMNIEDMVHFINKTL